MSNELQHHGIKGQKWGVRRFQNKNGSLTPAGKKRYNNGPVHDDYKRAHTGKKVSEMSDQELRDVNNRLNMERQHAQLTAKQSGIGKKIVQGILVAAATEVAKNYVSKHMKNGIEIAEKYAKAKLKKGGD